MSDDAETSYIVYWADDYDWHIETYNDLASARAAATNFAEYYPGRDIHVSAHMATFRAETVVKEV